MSKMQIYEFDIQNMLQISIIMCIYYSNFIEGQLPRPSVEVDTFFLLVELLPRSVDFPPEEAFCTIVCRTFFSEKDDEEYKIYRGFVEITLLFIGTDLSVHTFLKSFNSRL